MCRSQKREWTMEQDKDETAQQDQAAPEQPGPNRDRRLLPARLRTIRGQLLRGAATLTEDADASAAEAKLMEATQALLEATKLLE